MALSEKKSREILIKEKAMITSGGYSNSGARGKNFQK